MVGIFTQKGEAVAVARAAAGSEEMLAAKAGLVARTERVIMEPGVYPRAWKLAERQGVEKEIASKKP
jgi:H/ACA ribonucleoprotein complex subunit 4